MATLPPPPANLPVFYNNLAPLSSNAWRDVVYKGWKDIYYLEASSDSGPPAVGGQAPRSPAPRRRPA